MTQTMSPFGRKANNSEGGGVHSEMLQLTGLRPAVLVAMIGLGTHENEYMPNSGIIKKNLKVFLVWELVAEKSTEGVPFLLWLDFTDSLHKKANYRLMFEGWLGRTFSPDEEFDPITMLGKPCVLTVCVTTRLGEKTFAGIASVAPLMDGMQIPPATRPCFAWHMSQITCKREKIELPDWLPRIYGREVIGDIEKSKEWQALPSVSPEYALDHPQGATNGQAETMTSTSAY